MMHFDHFLSSLAEIVRSFQWNIHLSSDFFALIKWKSVSLCLVDYTRMFLLHAQWDEIISEELFRLFSILVILRNIWLISAYRKFQFLCKCREYSPISIFTPISTAMISPNLKIEWHVLTQKNCTSSKKKHILAFC